MRFVEQSFQILTDLREARTKIYKEIELAARTCYKSEGKITESLDSAINLIKKLVARGHWAMLEFGDVTVKFTTNRGVTHELVRHRIGSFGQESTRYVNYKTGVIYTIPYWFKKEDRLYKAISQGNSITQRDLKELLCSGYDTPDLHFLQTLLRAERGYTEAIEAGIPPQAARGVLPNQLKADIVVNFNLRQWHHLFELRDSNKAHPDMQALIRPLHQEFKKHFPEIFNPQNHGKFRGSI